MSDEKNWHELRKKVLYAENIDDEIDAWNEIERRLKEHKEFSKFLDEYIVLEIDEFKVWIPNQRESELKELCRVFLKEEIK